MLTAGVLRLDGAGRITTHAVADFPAPRFNGGTPTGTLGSLVIDTGPVDPSDVFVGGLRYSAAGALKVVPGAVAGYAPGGLQVDVNGSAVYSTGQTPARWIAGLPLDAVGGLCCAAPAPPLQLFAFSNAFSTAFNVEIP